MTVALLAGALSLPVALAGQRQESELTLERIHGSDDFSAEAFSGEWMADGRSWVAIERDEDEATSLVRTEAESGDTEMLVAASELVPPGADSALEVESFTFSSDERKILLFTNSQQVWRSRTKGIYWVFDLDARSLAPVSRAPGWQMFAKFSPDGGRVAFVRDHDLFVTDLASGEERALTHDGSETIINGTTDWVYEEELALRDAFRWSPDGTRIAYWQLDQSPVQTFPIFDETTLYPDIQTLRYPKAGTANSTVRVGSLDLGSGRTTWFRTDGETAYYIARMDWVSPTEVTIQTLNRHQNRLELLMGDAATGETRSILVDEGEAWVDVNDDVVWFDDGRRFVWASDRDGWNHLYLYARSGELVRQLTSGEWEVTGLEGVDEDEDRVYVTAAFRGPLGRSVLAVDLDGDVTPILDAERGTYGADFSPDFERVIHTYSTIASPPVITLAEVRDDATREIRVIEDNAALRARLERLALRPPEFLNVDAADGTPLNAWLITPFDFDESSTYGLLLYVYGGPGSQTAGDSWGGSRYVWHQYLAQQGVLVASVDNRGTGARGRDFKKQTYRRLGQLETADQLAAARQLGELPFVDPDRVGIWGWSYGGYMTLMATLQGGGTIAAGVSVAPVTDWKLYDTIYTERFMRTPQENPQGYDAGAPLTYAEELESPLLIIHGTADDNVHPQNTVQMIDALERAGKQFDMRLYPGKRHAIAGEETRVNLFRYITGFLLRHLGPEADRARNAA